MLEWQKDVINKKIEMVNQFLFSLEVDLRVSRKIGDTAGEKKVIEMIKMTEAQKLALEEELNG